eukprot:EG_transcript_4917
MPRLPFLANPVARLRQLRAETAEDFQDLTAEPSKWPRKMLSDVHESRTSRPVPEVAERYLQPDPATAAKPPAEDTSSDSSTRPRRVDPRSPPVVLIPPLNLEGLAREAAATPPPAHRSSSGSRGPVSSAVPPTLEEAARSRLPKRRLRVSAASHDLHEAASSEGFLDDCSSEGSHPGPALPFHCAQDFQPPLSPSPADPRWLPEPVFSPCSPLRQDVSRRPSSPNQSPKPRRPLPQTLTFVVKRQRPTTPTVDAAATRPWNSPRI